MAKKNKDVFLHMIIGAVVTGIVTFTFSLLSKKDALEKEILNRIEKNITEIEIQVKDNSDKINNIEKLLIRRMK